MISQTRIGSIKMYSRSEWEGFFSEVARRVEAIEPVKVCGRLTRVSGLVFEAAGLRAPVGAQCTIAGMQGTSVPAEVVGFSNDRVLLMPAGQSHGLANGACVSVALPRRSAPELGGAQNQEEVTQEGLLTLPMGAGLLGRVVDATGAPLDRLGSLGTDVGLQPLYREPLNAMERAPICEALDTGVKAINGLLTVGRGQRIGLFAGSGVGKSVLLGMMARYTQADVIVVGLIGERGREVKEFIEQILGAQGLCRSVVVAAPADTSPVLRMQGAAYATAIAEYFRDRGRHVLLLMDSLTRYAMAQREIALAIGEPPATKGYPPSCFAKLPHLVERSGNGMEGGGSITAFYTVLSEGDDQQDPVADAARAILDGHIVLSRSLAESGHFPAIDIEQSVSRVMHSVVSNRHMQQAQQFRTLYSKYRKGSDLIQMGAYVHGSDPGLDLALRLHDGMVAFLQQGMHDAVSYADSEKHLDDVLAK